MTEKENDMSEQESCLTIKSDALNQNEDLGAHSKNKVSAFWQGFIASVPLTIAATPFAVVYGALGESLELSFWIVMAISVFVFAGASQFIALTMIAVSAQLVVIVFTVMLVNLRHTLYAMTLAPLLKKSAGWKKVLMGFSVTDETFAVVVNRATNNKQNLAAYYAGSASLMYVNWIIWSGIGFVVGAQFPQLQSVGLDVAMVVAFTGIMVASLKSPSHWHAMIAAIIAAILTYSWPYQLGLLFSSLFAIAVGMWSKKRLLKGEAK